MRSLVRGNFLCRSSFLADMLEELCKSILNLCEAFIWLICNWNSATFFF
ncbi:unnamed protein product [Musa acuminata subsp. malaccensis]|uniref:(wild Malaysian banana) hypothetical protein n=1 Tax=Musa acuminata subsp. malaccensis TaxID=214687 RepID=A0A8D7F706_MUSAM|nr:unnamed protein product [Musa acuminata subsp. malaccensis]